MLTHMSRSDSFIISRVVGDILDPFTETIDLRVRIQGNDDLCNGCRLRPSQMASQPMVEIGGDDFRKFYTLLLVDADAPNPSNPYQREYLHWMVTDIPGSTGAAFGSEAMAYESPEPSMGIHRLVFVLFQQPGRQTVNVPELRPNFNTRQFAEMNNLGSPVAAAYFNCHRERGTGGRRPSA